MKYAVTMPSLGADMDEGKLLEWHIKPGDVIKKGDLIAAVETQKAAVDIESFRSGTVLELVGAVDQVIRVGSVIAYMDVADDGTVAAVAPAPAVTVTAPPASAAQPAAHAVAPSGKRLRVSPAARHLAEKNGVDLNALHGTGHDGAIELQDVEAALAKKDTAAPQISAAPQKSATVIKSTVSMINVREAIARAMAKSKREIPHYYLQSRFHIDTLVAWLDAKNRSLPPEERLFMPAVLMRAVVLALQSNPDMNGYYENGAFVQKPEIHLGITVSLKPSGVMTPAVIDAQAMTLAELNAAFADLVQRARAGKLRNREMTDGTVTVTNVGDLGADAVTGVIFPPQVSLVGFGRVRKAPVVDGDGGVRPGFVIDTSLSADHRVSDGLAGSKMLNTIGRLLAQPESLDK
jgi:pyruvate dehydrogenase E2 component (dihydrolipoamide acetyltransferase)